MEIFEDGQLDNFVRKLHENLEKSNKNLTKWEAEFTQICNEFTQKNLKKLFEDRADFMRDAKKTLETVFTNCCYSFRLNNLNYEYSYTVKQYGKINMSNTTQLN